MATLHELYYERQNRTVAVAHRGANHVCPENTLPAMREAVRLGADMIEFDLRMTRDHIPVLLHDGTIDRTSDGSGKPAWFILEELKDFNFGKIDGVYPTDDFVQIPTFEEVLQEFRDQVAMNIQVYVGDDTDALRRIIDLYDKYDMYDHGFLALSTFEIAEACKRINPRVPFGILLDSEDRSTPDCLRRCHAAGATFAQPIRTTMTPETFAAIRETGLLANVFCADTKEEMLPMIEQGIHGVLTNRIDILVDTINNFQK